VRWRSKRVGVDLDTHSELQVLKSYFNAKTLFPKSPVEVKITGHGFHLRIFKQHSLKANIVARRILGDDPDRIECDERRIEYGLTDWVDTLFLAKTDRGKQTREEDYNVLCLPFFSKFPCRKRVR
jgi:hypothetical protein